MDRMAKDTSPGYPVGNQDPDKRGRGGDPPPADTDKNPPPAKGKSK